MLPNNIILLTDSYKVTHWKQYPPKTTNIYSYFESRGGKYPAVTFFGLQYFIKNYLEGQVVTKEKIDEAESFITEHLGTSDLFNREGWEHILKEHDGRLPVRIKAVPEGTTVPNLNVLMTIENTDPKCHWLTNYLETLLVQVWYPSTVATQSRECKKLITKFATETGNPDLVIFKLHDFGFRGVSSYESAAIGGAAHLVNFQGTDTLASIVLTKNYYDSGMTGFSIPASEHSTITSWGQNGELDAFKNMLDKYPTGAIACVSDSYDIYNACKNLWGDELRGKIFKREGTLIVRPDSGTPTTVVNKVLNILGEAFGAEENEKGFKVLPDQIRVIQGDGVNLDSIHEILSTMKANGWSTDNIAFGMGGALLQKLDRDTQKFAFKCSNATIDGKETPVWKDPITDPGKISKRGRLGLFHYDGIGYKTETITDKGSTTPDILQTVFENGELIKEYTFDEIRDNAKINTLKKV